MTVPEFIFGKIAPLRGQSGTWNWTGPAVFPPMQVAVRVQTAASRFLVSADGAPVVVGATCVVTAEVVAGERVVAVLARPPLVGQRRGVMEKLMGHLVARCGPVNVAQQRYTEAGLAAIRRLAERHPDWYVDG